MKVLLVPDEIIQSIKGESNRTQRNFAPETINNLDAFLSPVNMIYMGKVLYNKHTQNGGSTKIREFHQRVFDQMGVWAEGQNLNSFEGLNNFHWVLTMDYINNKFISDNVGLFALTGADTNVFRTKVVVESVDNYGEVKKEAKKYDQMTAADYQNLDVWAPINIYTDDNKNRYANKIPPWQRTMHTRHISRENEGLRSKEWSRASLEVPQRGYNMSAIKATADKYKDLSWAEI